MFDQIHAEDVMVGATYDLGEHVVTPEEIVEFSRQWDPPDAQTGPETAGYFGGVIASGLHSMAIMQRLSVINVYRHWAILAGRQTSDVQFRAPVRPGMTLRATLVIDSIEPCDELTASITVSKTLFNDETVVASEVHGFHLRRRG